MNISKRSENERTPTDICTPTFTSTWSATAERQRQGDLNIHNQMNGQAKCSVWSNYSAVKGMKFQFLLK